MSNETQYRIYLCGGPNCTACGRAALSAALDDALWAWQLDRVVEVRVSGCQSRCEHAPNLTIWPGPYHYTHLTREAIDRIVEEHLLNQRPVADLLSR